MATATSQRTASADALAALAERFDPDVLDLRRGRARVRLEAGPGSHVRRGHRRAPHAASRRGRERRAGRRPERRPGHLGGASPRTTAAAWRRSARGASGSAAASTWASASSPRRAAQDEPGRLEFETLRTRDFGAISVLSAGTGPETILCVHGLGGTKASFLPTVNALADALPRGGDGPSRASASRTSRSARRTTPPGSRGRCSPPWMRSASTAPTWPATAWAAAWRSRRGSPTGTASAGSCC